MDERPLVRCFLHDAVECGAECMAYVTAPRTSTASELNEQQSHCALLLGVDRAGRALTILSSIASKSDIKSADDARAQQLTRKTKL